MFSRLNPERDVLDLGGLMSIQSTLVSIGHACGTKGSAKGSIVQASIAFCPLTRGSQQC